jgi:fucokinase
MHGRGQVVIASGDVLLDFDPEQIQFPSAGVTGLGYRALPEQASRHGVFCLGAEGQVRRFLQKPSLGCQRDSRAIDGFGRSVLDIGVVQFDAAVAAALLALCHTQMGGDGQLHWSGTIADAILRPGQRVQRGSLL